MPVKGGYLALAGGGALLVWSGLAGKSWSQVLRGILQGRKPEATTTAYTIQGTPASALGTTTTPGGTNSGASGPVGGTVAKNQAIARVLAAPYGWSSGVQWSDLVSLWDRESSWDNHALNHSSGAYGIPQSLPASKMGALANPPVSSASAQIAWGLRYIKGTYGSPVGAWAHEESAGWY